MEAKDINPKNIFITNTYIHTMIPHNAALMMLVSNSYRNGAKDGALVVIQYSLNRTKMDARVCWGETNEENEIIKKELSKNDQAEYTTLSQLRHRLFVDYSGLLVEKGKLQRTFDQSESIYKQHGDNLLDAFIVLRDAVKKFLGA